LKDFCHNIIVVIHEINELGLNGIIMTFAGIMVRFSQFIEEHFFYSIIIFILIISYFVPIPYLSDFVMGVVEFIKSLELISFSKTP